MLTLNHVTITENIADADMNGSGTAFDFLTVWLPANGQAAQVP